MEHQEILEDKIVLFETAKLASEKGFDVPCRFDWIQDENKEPENENCFSDFGELFTLKAMKSAKENGWDAYLAPTQSLLQRWIREKHDIHIIIIPDYNIVDKIWTYQYRLNYLRTVIGSENSDEEYNTYEEALENGLVEALNLIKNEFNS